MKNIAGLVVILIGGLVICASASAHCEVPCSIYDDRARIQEIHEHIDTIEKAMKELKALSKEYETNYNQIVRWVNTKEKHAEEIQKIVYQYFMTQRIKLKEMSGEATSPPGFFQSLYARIKIKETSKKMSDEAIYAKYIKELTLLHEMLVYAMKSKQILDPVYPKTLRNILKKFDKIYFGNEKK